MIVRSKRQTGQVRSPYLRHALRHASLACAGVLMSVALNAWPATSDAAGAASAPVAGAADAAPVQYTVQPGQSVTDIAEEITHSHDRATRDRMAAALFKANPGAFMGNDPDRLKIGATLVVPGAMGAAAVSVSAVSAVSAISGVASASSAELASATAAASATAVAATQAASAPAEPEALHETGSGIAAAPAAPLAASSSEHGRAWSGSIQTSNGAGLSAGSSITGMRGSTAANTGSVFSTPQGASPVQSSGVSRAAASATPAHATVSSLEQLLALKNRVLTALEKHGTGTGNAPAASAGVTAGSSAPTAAPQATANSPATAAPSSATQAGTVPASASAAANLGHPAARSQSWLASPLFLPVLGVMVLILLVALFLTWVWRPRNGSEQAASAEPAPSPLPGSVSTLVPAPTSETASAPAAAADNLPPRQAEVVPLAPSTPTPAVGAVLPVPEDGAMPPMPEAVRAAFGAIDLSLPELPPLTDEGATKAPARASEPVPMAEAGQASIAGESLPVGQQETPTPTPADDGAPVFAPPPTLHPQPDHAGTAAETGPASVAGLGAAGFGALDLNFDLESPAGAAQPATPFSDSDIAAIARNKLDLAIEYVKLGDVAGARTLITEVIESNDAATQIQARTLLASLAALS